MTDQQLYLAVGAPMLFNALLFGLVMSYVNAKIGGSESRINGRLDSLNQRFDDLPRTLASRTAAS